MWLGRQEEQNRAGTSTKQVFGLTLSFIYQRVFIVSWCNYTEWAKDCRGIDELMVSGLFQVFALLDTDIILTGKKNPDSLRC